MDHPPAEYRAEGMIIHNKTEVHVFEKLFLSLVSHPFLKMRRIARLLPILLLSFPAFSGGWLHAQAPGAPLSHWTIDKIHSRIGFSVSHFTITQVVGNFRDFDARVICSCPGDDFTGGTVEFTAKTASVFTDNKERDGHLQTDSFFGSRQFPEMRFTGTLVKEDGRNKLKGMLTIRDVTRPVSLDVYYGGRIRDAKLGIEKAGFRVSGSVNRLDFGMRWNESFEGGGAIVGKDVTLDLNVEIDKQP